MRVFVRPAQIPNMSSINRLNVQLYVKRALCNDIFLVHSAVILIHSGVSATLSADAFCFFCFAQKCAASAIELVFSFCPN